MAFYKLDSILFNLSCAVSDVEVFICHALQGITPENVREKRWGKVEQAMEKSNEMCKEIDGEKYGKKHIDEAGIKIPNFFKK